MLSTDQRIWIIGSSYIRRGQQRAKKTMGANLGLEARVWWFGSGGLRWSRFLPFFYRSLEGRTAPDVLLIHCGSNDLGKVKSIELATMMKKDLQHLHDRFPGTKLVFSQITQRVKWGAAKPGLINKARKWVNSEMGAFVRGLGGSIVAHPDIKFDCPGLFLSEFFSPLWEMMYFF